MRDIDDVTMMTWGASCKLDLDILEKIANSSGCVKQQK